MGIGDKITCAPRAAVFLDRDGVLNEAVIHDGKPYPPKSVTEIKLVSGASAAVQMLKSLGFYIFVVTNQPDIRRGMQDREVVDAINNALSEFLPVDSFLVCPHDDEDRCLCRKPLPGLLLSAARDANIDLGSSFMVGDRWRDIQAGQAAGVRTVFIDYSYHERRPDPPADITVLSVLEASHWIAANRRKRS